jgi:hypothetical protein
MPPSVSGTSTLNAEPSPEPCARYGLIVLGNPRILAKDPLWSALINHLKNHGCLVEGSLANLQVRAGGGGSAARICGALPRLPYRTVSAINTKQQRFC